MNTKLCSKSHLYVWIKSHNSNQIAYILIRVHPGHNSKSSMFSYHSEIIPEMRNKYLFMDQGGNHDSISRSHIN